VRGELIKGREVIRWEIREQGRKSGLLKRKAHIDLTGLLKRKAHIIITVVLVMMVSCVEQPPERTVRSYLQMLSGERAVTEAELGDLTTEHYRTTEHPHLHSLATQTRAQAIDLADELREDPAIAEFMQRVTWTTMYETSGLTEDSACVVARVIISERRPGDSEAAKEIEGLPDVLKDVLERGTELPFRFELIKENGRWKIDQFTFPESLLTLFDFPSDEVERSDDVDE